MVIFMSSDPNVSNVLRDISDIRRAVLRAEGRESTGLYARDLSAHRTIYLIALLLAVLLIGLELFGDPSLTIRLYATHFVERFRFIAVFLILGLLTVLTLLFYLVVWRAARRSDESFDEYVYRHFSYLRNLSFISDLFVKFAGVALIVLAGRPDWVAPLLLIYTGDYLLQGRFFLLPIRLGLVLGILVAGAGLVQLLWFEGELEYPLGVFIATLIASLFHIRSLARPQSGRGTAA